MDLQQAHDNWKCICPFHDERTPSFFIHKDNYLAHCFGCGIAGHIDLIVAKKCGISQAKARSLLGIKLEDIVTLDVERREKRPSEFPESWLAGWRRIRTHSYLVDRGFSEDTIIKGEARWDHNTKRVVFPLRDLEGKLIGAAGRATDAREPKWYFYWNCDKSQSVYRLHGSYGNLECTTLVEGVLDALWLIQNGHAACAILGSKPSKAQILQLKRYCQIVTIALDNDQAGEIGAKMLGDALKVSCDVKYASIPNYANDVCDLSKEELDYMLRNPVTPLEKKLNETIHKGY